MIKPIVKQQRRLTQAINPGEDVWTVFVSVGALTVKLLGSMSKMEQAVTEID